MGELLVGLTKYLAFYNTERPHQSLDNQTPQEVHQTSSGGIKSVRALGSTSAVLCVRTQRTISHGI
jgi:hypothetical protein